MWPWSNIGAGLGGTRRYERRVELPLGGEIFSNPRPREGIIVVGDIIKDDYFYVYAVSGSALIFSSDMATKWIGVTTNRGTVVVFGTAVLKTKYTPGSYKPWERDQKLGVGYMLTDYSVSVCDPVLSRIHIMDYLTQTPDDDGMYTVLVQVNGAPVPGYHLFPVYCVQNRQTGSNYWVLSGGVHWGKTLVYPASHYGRQLIPPDFHSINFVAPAGTQMDSDRWLHLVGNIITLPQIPNQCGVSSGGGNGGGGGGGGDGGGGGGGGTGPCDNLPPPQSECDVPCYYGQQYCYYARAGYHRWYLENSTCTYCYCDYNEEELTKIFCQRNGRLPIPGDELVVPCCAGRRNNY